VRDQQIPVAPYLGLAPFTSGDAPFFFGREIEQDVLYAHLRSHRLTVLYGRSGVGKSSLVQAGLIGHLLRIGNENIARTGAPQVAVVVVRSWRGKPVDLVRQAMADAPAHEGLKDALERQASRSGGTLFLILDQFEDYLRREEDQEFDAALEEIVNARDSSVRVLMSIQEEFLARMDRLEERIPGLFTRAVRLEPLDARAVENAIVGPLGVWNNLHNIPAGRAYRAEPELIAEVIRQLFIENDGAAESIDAPIGTAYLQVVLRRIWEEEVQLGSHVLQKQTLSKLESVQQIVQRHLDDALSGLNAKERRIAAELLRFLVTPFGNITALTVLDLVTYTRLPTHAVDAVLVRLSELRVARAVPGTRDSILYEIAHPSLGTAIRRWREGVDRHRSDKWKRLAIAAGIVLLSLLGATIWRSRQKQQRLARAGVLTEQAASLRSSQFDLSLLLSICALDVGGESASSALVQSLRSPAVSGMFIGWSPSPVVKTMSDPAAMSVTVASLDGSLRTWSVSEHRPFATPIRADWNNISDITFSGDSRTLALVAPDATVRIRSTLDHLFPIASFGVDAASVVAITHGGEMIAVGSADGKVHIHRTPFEGAGQTLMMSKAPIEALGLSADGRLMTTGSADGSIWLSASPFRPSDAHLMKQRGESVRCIVFSSDGRRFAAGTADGIVHLWSAVADGWTEQVFRTASGVLGLDFDAAAHLLAAAGEDGVIYVWSAESAETVVRLPGHDTRMRSIAFTADGRIIAGQDDGSTRLWKVATTSDMPSDSDLGSLRLGACEVANRNLSNAEWEQYMGNEPYRRICSNLPFGQD
jgi:WD40 repeat protein